MQPTAVAAPLPDQEGLKRQQESFVGRLVAEAGEAECLAADMQDQLQQLQCTKRCSSMLLDVTKSVALVHPACVGMCPPLQCE